MRPTLLFLTLLLPACTVTTGYNDSDTGVPTIEALPRNPPASFYYSSPASPNQLPPPELVPVPSTPANLRSAAPNVAPSNQQPHLSYMSPSYNLDPMHPYNRGQWTTVPGPSGRALTVWSTAPTPPAPFNPPLIQDFPNAGPGYVPPEYRYDPQLRR